jgi:sialate O-acetylesterase
MRCLQILLGILLIAGAVSQGADALWLPRIFSERMVLQREMPVPIWGRAAPGAAVTATIYHGGAILL